VRAKRPFVLVAALVAGLVLVDLALGAFLIRDGLFLGQPLPPFGALTHPRQRTWLERERRELEEGLPPGGPGRFDAELGWTTRRSFRNATGTITSNSQGARGQREYARPRPSGVRRVATFGDSFTYGAEVLDDETWQASLERADPRLEVPNYGVGGYGTDQALLRFRRLRERLDADVVILGILLENIGRNVNRYRPLWYPKAGGAVAKPRFRLVGSSLELVSTPVASRAELVERVGDGSILERLAPHEHWLDRPDLGWLAHSSLARIAGALAADRLRSTERLWRDRDGEPLATTLAILSTFVAEARASGIEHAGILLFPRSTDLPEPGEPRYWEDALAELGARGLDILDVAPALVEARASGPGEPLYRGGHLSPRGNAIVAREVRGWLGRLVRSE